jgi:hypothetical protein
MKPVASTPSKPPPSLGILFASPASSSSIPPQAGRPVPRFGVPTPKKTLSVGQKESSGNQFSEPSNSFKPTNKPEVNNHNSNPLYSSRNRFLNIFLLFKGRITSLLVQISFTGRLRILVSSRTYLLTPLLDICRLDAPNLFIQTLIYPLILRRCCRRLRFQRTC